MNPSRRIDPRDPQIYFMVEERRRGWDQMLWQVPILTFTGQAFLFTILLGSNTSLAGRVVAGLVSMGASSLSLLLFTRFRQLEQTESTWLEEYEKREGWPDDVLQHGPQWSSRLATPTTRGPRILSSIARRIPVAHAYTTWVSAHLLLILIAAVVVGLGFVPHLFDDTGLTG